MKKTNILYWIFTGLFSAFMLFSAIPDILVVPDAVTMITPLGYPKYIIPFLGAFLTRVVEFEYMQNPKISSHVYYQP